MGPSEPIGSRAPARTGGRVGYLDSVHRATAQSYAVATGRECLHHRSFEAALADPGLRVLILGPEPLRLAQLEQVAAREEPVGLLPISDPSRPVEAARSAYWYERCRRHGPGRRISHYPLGSGIEVDGPDLTIAGAVSADRAAALWRKPSALKLVLTHSDGVDAFVAKGFTACGRATWGSANDNDRPPCVTRHHCHRNGLSFDDPSLESRILDPAILTAGILLWDVCLGAPSAESPAGAGWSLFHRLWSAGAVGAVVTNFGYAFANAERLEALGDSIVAAASLGEGLKRVSREPLFARKGARWILFGDPDIAVSAPSGPRQASDRGGRPPPAHARRRSAVSSALCAAGETGLADALSDRRGDSAQAILQWALERAKLHDLWLTVDDVALEGQSVCVACGLPARCFSSFPNAPHRRRSLHICTACGVVGDVDTPGMPLLRRVGNRLMLTQSPLGVTRRAILQLWSDRSNMSLSAEWPERDGRPVRSFAIPAAWRGEFGRLSLFLAHDDDISIFSCLYSG